MADTRILQVTWAETGALTALDTTNATVQRLQAIVGRLAAQAASAGELGGFAPAASLPGIGESGHDIAAAMRDVVNQAADSGQLNGAKLPLRAVLWEIGPDGAPRNAEPPLPPGSSWVPKESTRQSDFKAPDGRYFRLYESDVIASPGSAAWVSGYTGSGLSEPPVATARADARVAWVIGISAAIIFLLGGWLSVWSGRSMSTARNILAANNVVVQNALLVSFANVCAADYAAFPAGFQASLCANVLDSDHRPPVRNAAGEVTWPDRDKALRVLPEARMCPANPEKDGCNAIWRAAVALDQAYSGSTGFFAFGNKISAYLTGTDAAGGSTSIILPFLMLLVGVASLIVALGLGTKQRVAGVWIDTRNRVSLARAQVTLWTVVALAGYAALALFNVGFSGIVDSEAIAAFKPFPSIPSSVAAALGIALVSPMWRET